MTEDERSDLAEAMVPKACELACLVRDGDADGIGRFLAARTRAEADALVIVLAAMIPVDSFSPGDLLAWAGGIGGALGWRQDPLMFPVELEPCPSLAAYRRHQRAGEPYVECGCEDAARAEWRERKRDAARKDAATREAA